MEYIELGRSGLRASRIGLGTWVMGGWKWGGVDEADAIRTVHQAVDQGINLIDTAPVYGFGRSEEVVGRALAEQGSRNKVLIATKVGLEWNAAEQVWRNSTPARIRKEIEDSLRRLRTDYIDLYQVHWPDAAVPIAETARTLAQLKDEGKIRAIGVSNFSPEQMDTWRQTAPLDTDQPPYNLFERGIEHAVLPYCAQNGIGTLVYGVLCRGLLSGKFKPETTFPADDLRSADPKFQGERFRQYLTAVERLKEFAAGRGKGITALAARWALDQPGVSVALWGARRPDQIESAADIAGWSLSAEELTTIDRILVETIHDPVGPEFMAPPEA